MVTIDWSKAGDNARAIFEEKVQAAAGDIVAGIDDLMEDANVPRQVKLTVLEQLGQVLGNREQLEKLLTGKVTEPRKALGGGGGGDTDTSAKDDKIAELEEKLEKAEKANEGLKKDRKVLEEVILDLGMSTPTNTSTPFNSDTPKRVKEKIDEKVKDAKATAEQERDDAKAAAKGYDEKKAKTAYKKAADAIEAQSSSRASTSIKGKDDAKAALDKFAEEVSLKTT